MQPINVQERLMFACNAVAVLRALKKKSLDHQMAYGDLAAAIGLSGEDGWPPFPSRSRIFRRTNSHVAA
jgi:hypothetical protein